jgi:hypothetical protein
MNFVMGMMMVYAKFENWNQKTLEII